MDNKDVEQASEPQQAAPEKDVLAGAGQLQDANQDRSSEFLVKFDKGDPANPRNFNPYYKAWTTFTLGTLAFAGSVGSAIVTPAEEVVAEHFGVSQEVTTLLLSLFVLGFAFGPMFWAPISEAYGRRWSVLPPVVILALFSVGTGFSKNMPALLITRFLGGVFGSAPISNVSAALGDFYAPENRGIAMSFYAMCVNGGPAIAPLIGAAVTVNPRLGWRWTAYTEAIIAVCVVSVAFFALPETYGPVLLDRKAKFLRKTTGDERYWHPHENEKFNLQNVVTKHLSRPLRMLTTEPIVTCMALYASYVYGLLFLQLELFPIIFRDERGYSPVIASLPLLALMIGVFCAMLISMAFQPMYRRAVQRNKGRPAPEARCPPMVIGGVMFSVGLFWLGWTATPRDPWILPCIAAVLIGGGFTVVFQQCLNVLVDTYGPLAASATSANTILRSLLACGLPLAARPMFLSMGVGPGASVLGGISCLALPVPFIFMRYGEALRKMSKFAPTIED